MKILNKLDSLEGIKDGTIHRIYRTYRSVTGVAAVTTSPYTSAKWSVTDSDVTAYTDGMVVDVKIPVVGNDNYGTVFQINSLGFKPVVYNKNSMIGSGYEVGSHISMVYNASQTAIWYNNGTSSTTATGCWQVMDYNRITIREWTQSDIPANT